jgi:RNA polymerase sigma factor (sigma-70 family)
VIHVLIRTNIDARTGINGMYEELDLANADLFARLMAGDNDVRKKLIETNMVLAENAAEKYVLSRPGVKHLKDDLISDGYLALVKAVDAIKKSQPTNVSAYLNAAINHAINLEADNNESQIKCSSKRRFKSGAVPHKIGTISPNIEGDIPIPEKRDSGVGLVEADNLMNELFACCTNDQERAIVYLRSRGKKNTQIAKRLHIDRTTVGRVIDNVRAKLAERGNVPAPRKATRKTRKARKIGTSNRFPEWENEPSEDILQISS